MARPKILIVGCGAVGLTQGFFLSPVADITYLVRPGRSPAFAPPKRLYNYKTDRLHTFDSYRVVESTSELAGERFAYVLDTLDGATALSDQGAATLRSVGDLIRPTPETLVIYQAMGLDIADHYQTTMSLGPNRVAYAGSTVAHQATPTISIPPTATRSLAEQADILYTTLGATSGLQLMGRGNPLVRDFVKLYDSASPDVRAVVGPGMDPALFSIVLVPLMGGYLVGYPPAAEFVADRDGSFGLTVSAQREGLGLPRFGWTGRVLGWLLGGWVTGWSLKLFERKVLPLKANEFNAFHFGAKVMGQNAALLEKLIAEGEKVGKKMEACRELLKRINVRRESKKDN